MSVIRRYDSYSEACKDYNIGRKIVEEFPAEIVRELDNFVESRGEVDITNGPLNPDYIYVNSLSYQDNREIIENLDLDSNEKQRLYEQGLIDEYVADHLEDIISHYNDRCVVLGYVNSRLYILE